MMRRWLCLFLVTAFMLQSVAAGADTHDFGHSAPEHQSVSLDPGHMPAADHGSLPDCDVHQHGHCCHGHFSAVLNSHAFDFSSSSNRVSVDYEFFVPSSPSSELLHPPTV
jgi:hypothetical protein